MPRSAGRPAGPPTVTYIELRATKAGGTPALQYGHPKRNIAGPIRFALE